MGAQFSINPNLIRPQPGMGEESAAASSGAIVTGIEKELNIQKAGKLLKDAPVDMKEVGKYIEQLTETTSVEAIKKRDEKRRHKKEDEDANRQRRSPAKNSGKGVRPAFGWLKNQAAPPKPIVLRSGLSDKFLSKIEPSTVKEYARVYIKTKVGLPKEDLKEANALKRSIEQDLIGSGVPLELITKIQEAIDKMLFQDLSRLIKETVLRSMEDKRFGDWLVNSKRSEAILNFALYNDDLVDISKAQAKGLTGKILKSSAVKNWSIKQKDPKELTLLAEDLNIDLLSWIFSFLNEKVKVTEDGSVILDSSIIEAQWRKSRLMDEFKMLHIALLIEDDFVNRFFIARRLGSVEEGLRELGIEAAELEQALSQAKKIAWAKVVTQLKEAHLKRVFSSSEEQFEKLSGLIGYFTKKARHIGMGVSKEGAKLVEAKVVQIALDTAAYKLELLKSMQSLEHDKSMDKDIKWLSEVIARLKGQEERMETAIKISNWFGRILQTR